MVRVCNMLCVRCVLCLVVCTGPVLLSALSPPSRLLVVMFDGFRHDYVQMATRAGKSLPNFKRLTQEGVTAEYVTSVFTTVTYPNMYSMMTGFHPDHHGVVHNTMYDPQLQESVNHLDGIVYDSKWWLSSSRHAPEPVWVTNERASDDNITRRSGAYLWRNGIVRGAEPYRFVPYDLEKALALSDPNNIDTVISWFKSADDPINLCVMYIEEPDFSGHAFGSSDPMILDKLVELDHFLGYLFGELAHHNLSSSMNLMLTSDHGMVDAPDEKVLIIDELIDVSLFSVHGASPVIGIVPTQGKEAEAYAALHSLPHVTVYHKQDIPERFHYSAHHRIQPIVVIADEGWNIYPTAADKWNIKGNHGYDNSLPSMRPFFMARGPAFKQNYSAGPLEMIDLYSLMCKILEIPPNNNDGDLTRIQHVLKTDNEFSSLSAEKLIKYILVFAFCILLSKLGSYMDTHLMRNNTQ